MTEYVAETYEEVRELLQTASWEIMDEEQRDDVMRKVVVPRWGKTTHDGVVLKSTAWAKALGTTYKTIEGRYARLARSETQDSASRRDELTEHDKTAIRHAKRVMRDPKLREAALGDPDVTDAVEQAVASDPAATARVNQKAEQHRPTPVRPSPARSSMSAAASLTALEAVAADLRRVTDEVVADVMDGQADPKLLLEPTESIEVDAKRLRIASDSNQTISDGLADLLREEI